MTWGQAQLVNQPSPSAPMASRIRASSDATAMASRMPRESFLAWLAMLASWPAAGISSQAATYTAPPIPPLTKVISTKTIRTAVTLRPFHAAAPAATPPTSRSSWARRSGPLPRLRSQNGPRCQCPNGSPTRC